MFIVNNLLCIFAVIFLFVYFLMDITDIDDILYRITYILEMSY